jgi:hypothetical protein
MDVNLGLLGYLPLPQMPFDKVPQQNEATRRVEESAKAIDKKVEKYKYTDAYTYHPHNMNKIYPQRQGEHVDFVVA